MNMFVNLAVFALLLVSFPGAHNQSDCSNCRLAADRQCVREIWREPEGPNVRKCPEGCCDEFKAQCIKDDCKLNKYNECAKNGSDVRYTDRRFSKEKDYCETTCCPSTPFCWACRSIENYTCAKDDGKNSKCETFCCGRITIFNDCRYCRRSIEGKCTVRKYGEFTFVKDSLSWLNYCPEECCTEESDCAGCHYEGPFCSFVPGSRNEEAECNPKCCKKSA